MTNDTELPDKLPRYAIYRNRKARIIGYDPESQRFDIIDYNDNKRRVKRIELKFLKEG